MIKRILICVVLLLLSAYMVIAVTAFNRKPENRICEGVELVVKDKVDYGFITENGIKSLLKHAYWRKCCRAILSSVKRSAI